MNTLSEENHLESLPEKLVKLQSLVELNLANNRRWETVSSENVNLRLALHIFVDISILWTDALELSVPEAAQLDSAVQHQDGWFKHCNPNRLVALPDHLSQLENLRKHLVWKRLNDFRREGLTTLFGEKDLQTEKAFKHHFKQLHLN